MVGYVSNTNYAAIERSYQKYIIRQLISNSRQIYNRLNELYLLK